LTFAGPLSTERPPMSMIELIAAHSRLSAVFGL
jgi:hypothetical protein